MYYLYVVKLGMNEDGFFRSTLNRAVYLIDKWAKEQKMKADALSGKKIQSPPQAARSIKEVLAHYGK